MTHSELDHLGRELVGGVLTLTLQRPERLNALTPELLDDLRAEIVSAGNRSDVRCVVITGSGRAFSSGQDIASGHGIGVQRTLADHYNPLILAIAHSGVPTIAAVNGVAAGAGASLTLACDLRILGASARYAFLFARVGLAADAGTSWFLPRLVGPAAATELLLDGATIDAETARSIGLTRTVVPDADLLDVAREQAVRLAGGPASLGLIRAQLRASPENGLEEQLRMEIELQSRAAASSDYAEGRAAFREKRRPSFTGR